MVKRILLLILSLLLSPVAAEAPWPPKTFTCYYGPVDQAMADKLADFELLVVHPGDDMANLTREKVEMLRKTGRSKTIVGYISIGETDVSPGGPPEPGLDESGPTYVSSDKLTVTLAGNGYPSRFLDQRAFVFGPDGFLTFGPNGKPQIKGGQDGHPDENGVWGSYYVKADDPGWQALVLEKLKRLDDLGLDGFFLDTVDTASPWGDYGWTSAGMLELVARIRQAYPEKRIVGNRGLFYLNGNDKYSQLIDAVLFESLMNLYNDSLDKAVISPWVSGHVQILNDGVIPSQRNSKMHLLVLEYLSPEQDDLALLVHSTRSLLAHTPHSLTFSHPLLKIPGWTTEDLLKAAPPASWPTVTDMTARELEAPGAFELTVQFDAPIPEGAISDLRFTSDAGLNPKRAAQLGLVEVKELQRDERSLVLEAQGLNLDTAYTIYFRLVSSSPALPSGFAWTRLKTRDRDLPGQPEELSSSSDKDGLLLKFSHEDAGPTRLFRVYRRTETGRKLVQETKASPARITQLEVDEAAEFSVVPVGPDGNEGYPSSWTMAKRVDVVPPGVPGRVTVEGNLASWTAVEGAKTYRLYVVPEGTSFRLPVICDGTQFELESVKPGRYQLFLTAVDKAGNQSRPGPKVQWTAGI